MSIKKVVFGSVLLMVSGLFLYVFFNYGFLEVKAENTKDATINVSGDSKNERSIEQDSRTFVKKGIYQVNVSSGDKEYLAQAHVKGMWRTITVKAEPEQQKARSFVVDNPAPCLYESSQAYYSSPCGSLLDDLRYHKPATISSPTYTKTVPGNVRGYIEGGVMIAGQEFLLVRESSSSTPRHILYSIEKDALKPYKELSGLDPQSIYYVENYVQGFSLVSLSTGEFVVFDNKLEATKQTFEPSYKDLPLAKIINIGDKTLLVYTKQALNDSFSHEPTLSAHSEVVESLSKKVIIRTKLDDSKFSDTQLDGVDKIELCAPDKLCALHEGTLTSFLLGAKLKKNHQIIGVSDFTYMDRKLLLNIGGRVADYSFEVSGGPVVYAIPENYLLCGISFINSKLHVCIYDGTSKQYVLRIDLSQMDQDRIDERVAALKKAEGVSSVSINGKFLHLAPDIGEQSFQKDSGVYGYTELQLKSARTLLREAVAGSGILDFGYSVIYGL